MRLTDRPSYITSSPKSFGRSSHYVFSPFPSTDANDALVSGKQDDNANLTGCTSSCGISGVLTRVCRWSNAGMCAGRKD